jgi:hypothetical protein
MDLLKDSVPFIETGLRGIFSQESVAFGNSTVWYSTSDGGEVEVTLVYHVAEGRTDRWSDAVDVGPVVRVVRDGRPDRFATYR